MSESDIKQHQKLALEKIKSLYDTPDGEFGTTLFVSHHLDELDASEWLSHYKTETPNPNQILDSLVLVNSWSSEDDGSIDTYDFSLPNGLTNYVMMVRFDGDKIIEVDMES